ncbi:hypothetical protein Pmani_021952 [Petrolisthes manimaculis]|uniref:Uncharacterized protein n=1 Tax=Petrolisthes manimaculis TaxID=1843537 RepID=A0AAE1PFD1_9EUCA|nr:hypothetical protein Pmani_021952 [Petrolisthes manimaculis]
MRTFLLTITLNIRHICCGERDLYRVWVVQVERGGGDGDGDGDGDGGGGVGYRAAQHTHTRSPPRLQLHRLAARDEESGLGCHALASNYDCQMPPPTPPPTQFKYASMSQQPILLLHPPSPPPISGKIKVPSSSGLNSEGWRIEHVSHGPRKEDNEGKMC